MNDEPLNPQTPNPKIIVLTIIGVGLLLTAFSSFYTVDTKERAVVMRLGRFIGITGPGGHFKLPWGIDRFHRVDVTTMRKTEFGFRTLRAGVNSSYSRDGFLYESLMLTGDLNVATVEWTVKFKATDPYKYLFRFRNVNKTIRDISEAAMRTVIGDSGVTSVLTTGRTIIAKQVKDMMTKILSDYDIGVEIYSVILGDVNPPAAVKASFNEVNAAKQEGERLINEGETVYNKTIPLAKGQAAKLIQDARGYALERINRAKGDAKRFDLEANAFLQAPEITRQRLYFERMQSIFANDQAMFIADPAIKNLMPFINARINPEQGIVK